MKKLSKVLVLVLSAIMVLAMSASVFAQDVAYDKTDKGSATIKVTNAAKGETYTVYKVFDATVTGTTNGSIAYKGDIPASLSNLFEKRGNTGYVQRKDGVTDQQILDALKANAASFTKMTEAVSDGSALNFTDLPYGYYVVTSTQDSGGAVTVTSTNPNAEIQDKNTTTPVVPSDGKTVNDENVNIGQTLTYTLKFKTANYEGSGANAKQILAYTAKDTLPEYLSDVTVTSIKIDGTEYKVNGATPQFDNKQIEIPWVDQTTKASLYKNGAEVVITYTAVVNDKIKIAGTGNKNEFTMTYTTSDGEKTPDQHTDSVTIKSYAFAIKKVDEKANPLAGAEFTLPFYVNETAASDGSYTYAGTAAGTGLTNVVKTPATGEIVIKGVEARTYEITESKAPEGYNQLTAPVSVTAQETEATTTTVTKYIDENGQLVDTKTDVEVTYSNTNMAADPLFVINTSGTALPTTGGIGTTIFYVLGSLLVVGCGIVLVSRRRMENNK